MAKLRQLTQFALVGGVNTILTYLLYLMLFRVVSPTIAMGIGYGTTSILGLFLNDSWVFRAKNSRQLSVIAPKYYATYGLTFILSMVLTAVWNDQLHLAKWLAPMFSLMITVPTNFCLCKWWVFKDKQ